MEQISSGITGALAQVERAANSTGQPHGETGHGNLPTINADAARDWLVRQEPEAVDRALRTSLRSSLDVEVAVRSELRFPPEGGFYSMPSGCDVGGVGANLPAAIAKIEAAMTTLTKGQAEEWLAALQATKANPRKSDAGQELSLALYSGALVRYPADVAKAVCMRLAMRGAAAWFPPLAEIVAMADRLTAPRISMLNALKRANEDYRVRLAE